MIDFDISVPNAARIYDALLDGKNNFAVDRAAAEQLLAASPDVRTTVRDNRLFLQRAVSYLGLQGIHQFIDIGAGLPTVENTHEVARNASSDTRVAYVDYDPVVVNHAKVLMADEADVIVVGQDLHKPQAIIEHPDIRRHIDFAQPLAILLVAILHFVDDRAYEIVHEFKQAMPDGSYLVLSHATADFATEQEREAAQAIYADASAPLFPRTRAEITQFFDGLQLVEPGITGAGEWQAPAHVASRVQVYAGVAVKAADGG